MPLTECGPGWLYWAARQVVPASNKFYETSLVSSFLQCVYDNTIKSCNNRARINLAE